MSAQQDKHVQLHDDEHHHEENTSPTETLYKTHDDDIQAHKKAGLLGRLGFDYHVHMPVHSLHIPDGMHGFSSWNNLREVPHRVAEYFKHKEESPHDDKVPDIRYPSLPMRIVTLVLIGMFLQHVIIGSHDCIWSFHVIHHCWCIEFQIYE